MHVWQANEASRYGGSYVQVRRSAVRQLSRRSSRPVYQHGALSWVCSVKDSRTCFAIALMSPCLHTVTSSRCEVDEVQEDNNSQLAVEIVMRLSIGGSVLTMMK